MQQVFQVLHNLLDIAYFTKTILVFWRNFAPYYLSVKVAKLSILAKILHKFTLLYF